ncbi:organic cation transporter protein [Lasioglossum baleicum]|uniref:organic cation transporter protein n=1 Tax=Lasioglossum baleicum TaxID=434251 RepID=UPI003FCE7F93
MDPCQFGKYQKYLFGMLTIFCLFLTFVYFSQAFLVALPKEYWCQLPLVEGVSKEKLRDIMIPRSKLVPFEGHHLPYSRCWIYDTPVAEALSKNKPDESWPLKKCMAWDFKLDKADVPYMSVAAEQHWVCDEAYKIHVAQSIFFIGSIVGGFVFGWISDKYGRIPVLIATNMSGFIGGICSAHIHCFWQFCFCRFIVGLAYDNIFVMAYILVLEYVGPRWRTFAANMAYGVFFTLGGMTLPWMAYGISNWRTFSIVSSLPLAFAALTPFLLPESVRWLVSKGQIERAVGIIRKIEKRNDRIIPDDVFKDFVEDCKRTADKLASEEHSILDLLKTKRLRKITLLLTFSWGIIQMSYDAHIRCLDFLGMDIFTIFTVASATELPAVLVVTYTLDVVGRRWTMVASVVMSGFFCLIAATFSVGAGYATFAMFARFFINVASNIAMQYAAELLPTVVRGEGVAFIHVMGYVTSILSPFIAFSSKVLYSLPMIILGIVTLLAGLLCVFLPETLLEQLPQTLEDGEVFGIDQKFWENPLTRMKRSRPVGHHVHARRPISRPALLRSSMISGPLGYGKRVDTIKKKASNSHILRSFSFLPSKTPKPKYDERGGSSLTVIEDETTKYYSQYKHHLLPTMFNRVFQALQIANELLFFKNIMHSAFMYIGIRLT